MHTYLCCRVADLIKKSSRGDANHEEHKRNKTGLKWGHLKHLHVSEEVSPRSLHSRTHNMGHKHGELEICVQLQG